MIDITLPELGEGITDVEIGEILVNVGDEIKTNEPIIVLETEKASMEIPSTKTGVIETMQVKKGDVISIGKTLISMKVNESSIQDEQPIVKEHNELERKEKNKYINNWKTNAFKLLAVS